MSKLSTHTVQNLILSINALALYNFILQYIYLDFIAYAQYQLVLFETEHKLTNIFKSWNYFDTTPVPVVFLVYIYLKSSMENKRPNDKLSNFIPDFSHVSNFQSESTTTIPVLFL